MNYSPFSENIIFVDTEFSDLNPYNGEILSAGLVKFNGEELYVELEHSGGVSEWVKTNIVPMLSGPKVSRDEAKKLIKSFVGKNRPYAVSYVNQYDTIYLYKLFTGDEHPFCWLPIDFASMLFANGVDPKSYYLDNPNNYFDKIGVDPTKYQGHHARKGGNNGDFLHGFKGGKRFVSWFSFFSQRV